MYVVIPFLGRKDSPVLQGWEGHDVECGSAEEALVYAADWIAKVDQVATAAIQKLHVAELDDRGLIVRTIGERYSFQRILWMTL